MGEFIFFSQIEGSSDSPNAWAMLLGWRGGQVVRSCPLGVTLSLNRHKLGLWEKLPAQDQAAQCGHYLVKGSQELVKVRGWDTARPARSTRNRLRISFLGPPGGARASHSHLPCSLFSAEEVAPLCGQTGPSTHLWGLRRRPAHMQARRQRRPRQTPTMMPVTECTSKESGRGEGGKGTDQGQEKTRGS